MRLMNRPRRLRALQTSDKYYLKVISCFSLVLLTEFCAAKITLKKVAGFPVFGCAQPTEEGFKGVLEKVPRGTPEKPIKTVW